MTLRRMLAGVSADRSPFDGLADVGAPSAVLRAAQDALESRVSSLLDRVRRAGWRWLAPADDGYPTLLGELADPPLGLFVRGELARGPRVAVVGSRRATAYGRQVARLLGEELATAGVVVVSGMARGVDAAAHDGALAAGGTTWAVWGTGPDRLYPPEHGDLAERIAASGALITEYLPGTPPRRHHFPERNRLLAGMARAVVVVEAAARSGALVTARLAVDEGREVFAVPGSIFSELSVGPNALLRLGARPLLTPTDLLEAVGVSGRSPSAAAEPLAGLLGAVGPGESVTVDELASRTGRPVAEVLEELLRLELSGDIERQTDGRFSLTRGMHRIPR